ncbi:hypothetical protein [Rodentibacter haemolyticus]|uniref:Uncharacterized protein n=1 Tax=Rodentibacter haemolyticus TaxID=2778911 RepID=A0ABX6UYR9_9PAST|nr:hypothetical protein [Rodentibacter haemolyticus]QPB42241.1 hypothetical protein IHV77_10065 [Rodentibacter haemolyticus]
MKKQDIQFVRGDDYSLRFRLVPPVDLMGCRFDLHAREDEDSEPVIKLSNRTGEIEIYPDSLLVHFPHKATESAEWDIANYDLQLIDLQGKRRTLLMGKIKLIKDQTRV